MKTHFSLRDSIVADSLDSLAQVQQQQVVVGGLAIQIHGRDMVKLLRDTLDADLIAAEDISYEDFVEQSVPGMRDYLKARGYTVQQMRGRSGHTAKIMRRENRPDMEQFLVHFTIFTPRVKELMQDYVAKQIQYAQRKKPINCNNEVLVASLEEVVPLKIQRCIRYGVDRETLVGPVYSSLVNHAVQGNWGYLASMPIYDWVGKISRMQGELEVSPKDEEKVKTYKLSKDIFDLCLASRIISDTLSDFDRDRYFENIQRIVNRNTPPIAP
jgi:hypothetical protein